ncbi:glutaminyl-peptide cyclotransferase [Brevundimonas sp.]|uniref:glutaminyl-peptide cyclotransferase n=1 Tax=Brevundimonas sp. TaxID=1871086 RepID=UPI002D28447F|nr:glutaminyl-peptide cyclotransferase [Brevundimonas sp.]HYD26583.1 glutaminyl-peptide cyclotransferase [Brevundimonas sp.]
MRRAAALAALLLTATAAVAQTSWAQTPSAQTTAGQTSPPAAPAAFVEPVFHGFEVVRVLPHDRGAFTQGLAYVDGVLFESTGRHPSTVRRVRLDDGAVLQRVDLAPDLFGEGLTEIGGRLFTLTWMNGKGFVWNAADLSQLGEFPLRGEGWGLTDDGTRLIMSDGTPTLRFLDPATLAETGRVQVTFRGRPLPRLNELEWIDGEVWANVWTQDAIVRIDPATGVVTGVVDLTGLLPDRTGLDPVDDVLNGIAWDPDGRRLFVTGKNWPSLFEIRLTGPH